MRRRAIALLAALAVLASVLAASALAEEQTPPESGDKAAAEPAQSGPPDDAGAEDGAPDAETGPEAPTYAGPDLAENITREPDAVGHVSFANLERRMRENNLQILVIEQSILTVEDIDYDDMYQELWEQLNQLARAQWGLVLTPAAYVGGEYEKDKAYTQLDQAYDAVRDSFDAIKDGEMQKDNEALVRQLKNLQDQIVVAGESLYVALQSMEVQEANLQRQLDALDRTVAEMELRYTLGQISAMQLSQVRSGRTALESGLATLRMNIRNYKLQLEMLIGAEQTGEIELDPVPEVTAEQLAEMDPETGLAAAKERSYELLEAQRTLEDARDDYKDALNDYGYGGNRNSRAAIRSWQAAQYTYNDKVQNYELKFRTLYAQVGDYRQIFEAAQVALACEREDYAAAELRFRQGTISQNALLEAEDALREAENKVLSAANDLFSTYNAYCWAVENGILN